MSNRCDYVGTFISKLSEISRSEHRYKIFRDFVDVTALAFTNLDNKPEPNDEYLKIISHYGNDFSVSEKRFSELLSITVNALEEHSYDFLGDVYMQLDLGKAHQSQYFTPEPVCALLCRLNLNIEEFKSKPYTTLSEPSCGSGSMIIAYVNELKLQGINPQEKLWVSCVDIDPMVARMCFIQLNLLGIAGEVYIGNTLSMKMEQRYRTLFHFIGEWDKKFEDEKRLKLMRSFFENDVCSPGTEPIESIDEPVNIDFDITIPTFSEEQLSFF